MPKRLVTFLLLFSVLILAACGGEEPAPTPTPLATFTPTAVPTARPSATAAETPTTEATATPAATATAAATVEVTATAEVTATPTVTATDTVTGTDEITAAATLETTATITANATPAPAAAGDGFASPLTAPDSPLAPPALAADGATPAPLKPVTGSWQLQTIRPSSNAAAADAPDGYRVAFGPTGVVRVMGDCKSGRGTYTSDASGALSIDITYNDTRCAPDSLADPFALALNNVTGYRFDGDKLVLAHGEQGGEMGLARTAQMASFGAPFLSWSNLQNSTYFVPEVPAGNNQAPLVDGEFRASLISEAATGAETAATPTPTAGEFVVSLATMHTYGVLVTPSAEEIAADPEITAEVSADTVVVLVVEDGKADSAPRSYLGPVLNGGGLPLPLPLELLGDNIIVRDLRWDGTLLAVDYDQADASMRRVYRFDNDHFVLENEEQVPPRTPKARLDLPAQSVTLGAGDTQAGMSEATMTGAIAAGEIHPYRLPLEAGQQLSVTIQSPYDNVWLSIFGSDDQTVLRSIRSDTTRWTGNAPAAQEYLISAVAPGSNSPYTLTIQVTNGSDAAAPPTAVPAPQSTPEGKVVHLVIDSAAGPANALLELLQGSNATVDFFTGAEEAAQAGPALAAAAADGHGTGIIASPLRSLTSDGRDALFSEVSAARQALGGEASAGQAVRCLRLPAAAGDAYTRAAAAELGYEVLQWDIDAGSSAADALLGQLFPNAVVRLDGEDGDALAATLETLLPALAQQGYSVQSLCSE